MKEYTCTTYDIKKIPKYKEILSVFNLPDVPDQRLRIKENPNWDINIYESVTTFSFQNLNLFLFLNF